MKVLKEMKNSTRTQSVPSRRYQERNTPRAGTSKHIDNEGGGENASEPENQENEIQDNPFRPSNMNELRTPIQPLSIQNIDLNDSVVINEDRTGEDYHTYLEICLYDCLDTPGKKCHNFLILLSKIAEIHVWNKLKSYKKIPISTQNFSVIKLMSIF